MTTSGVIHSFMHRIENGCSPGPPEQNGYEICYVHSGSCWFYSEPDFVDLEEGDLLIRGRLCHGLHATAVNVCGTRTNIRFDEPDTQTLAPAYWPVDVWAPFRQAGLLRWKLEPDRKIELESIFNKMAVCHLQANPVAVHRFHHAFLEVLLLICEFCGESKGQQPERSTEKEAHVRHLVTYIGDHYGDELTLEQLAKTVNLNKYYAGKLFKESTGLTLFDYIRKRRVVEAKRLLLQEPERSVTDISLEVGFKQLSHFSSSFKQITGLSPEQLRKCRQEAGSRELLSNCRAMLRGRAFL
ncbi:helix-turn-helix transcriptional regulator [Paenibacillus oceani]|uniref:Helix-turn-helix transcriptional regulator n=1 Tax=Paenibacillus oceani TaxID=2772510 RepID=A0A927CA54_9BACL|nr:AraC family transcriptional regulator [Paenibacillus oceani]MBD2862928.1 helix-turn-helix transcriptional regulator [Paenibacillus oceani]